MGEMSEASVALTIAFEFKRIWLGLFNASN